VARTRHDVLAAAVRLLTTTGWDRVTHANVAVEAGYSKGTLYVHWPERIDLLRDTLSSYKQLRHHTVTGDLRADLIGELITFRSALLQQRRYCCPQAIFCRRWRTLDSTSAEVSLQGRGTGNGYLHAVRSGATPRVAARLGS
jgi:AcrR family transcriptional regulator